MTARVPHSYQKGVNGMMRIRIMAVSSKVLTDRYDSISVISKVRHLCLGKVKSLHVNCCVHKAVCVQKHLVVSFLFLVCGHCAFLHFHSLRTFSCVNNPHDSLTIFIFFLKLLCVTSLQT